MRILTVLNSYFGSETTVKRVNIEIHVIYIINFNGISCMTSLDELKS